MGELTDIVAPVSPPFGRRVQMLVDGFVCMKNHIMLSWEVSPLDS